MATTTNYGWSTPDDTALVSQGAAAIRTLGSSVDTTVKALSPGTTAGDVDYYTSSTAKARLGIGTTGQVLTVAGGVPSWATATAGGMTLISTTTLTGSSVTLSSIPQTYQNLYLIVKGVNPSTNGGVMLRVNNVSTANSYRNDTTTSTGVLTFNTTEFPLSNSSVPTGQTNNNFFVTFYDYTNTNRWKFFIDEAIFQDTTTVTSMIYNRRWGVHNPLTAITSLVIYPESPRTFNAGTALLYGVN